MAYSSRWWCSIDFSKYFSKIFLGIGVFSSGHRKWRYIEIDDDDNVLACFTFLHSYCRATQSARVREVGPTGKCFGYRLCGDNINKIIKTHYIRLDKQNILLQYLHSYVVVNFSDNL